MHYHNHSCSCEHEHIKFCKRCFKPFCEDCGKEWTEPCTQNHYYTTYPWYSYGDGSTTTCANPLATFTCSHS
jgi:hypothetical protein